MRKYKKHKKNKVFSLTAVSKRLRKYTLGKRMVLRKPVKQLSLRISVIALLVMFVTGTAITLFQDVTQAAISSRGSNTSKAGAAILFRAGSSSDNAGGSTSLTLATPTGTIANDLMLAVLTIRGGTGTSITSVPSGWTIVDSKRDSGTDLAQVVYRKVATSNEPADYTWQFTSNKATGVILSYANVDTSAPINVASGQVNASSTTATAPSVTTTVANTMLVGFFGSATGTTVSATSMTTLRNQATSAGGGAAGTKATTGTAEEVRAATGSTGTRTATFGAAAVNIGHIVALTPFPSSSLTLTKPTGTIENDVLIASITITGNTTLTPPSGWTSIRRTVTASNEIAVETYYKVATNSEPANYSWTWTGSQRVAGVITAYSGVNTSSPVADSFGQMNASSINITAPTITAAVPFKLIGVFAINNASTITAPSSMTSRGSTGITDSTSAGVLLADQDILSGTGTTGTRVATAGTAGPNAGQLIALTPTFATLNQGNHRWFDQPQSTQIGVDWISRSGLGSAEWRSVAYGNNKFVAINSIGGAAVSVDGINWSSSTIGVNGLKSVTYGNGLFMAVGQKGIDEQDTGAAYSVDGVTWTASTVNGTQNWSSVTFGNGLFVAVASGAASGDSVMTTTNGVTWTDRTESVFAPWNSITYGNGLFVAVSSIDGTSTSRVMTSPDGINWTTRTASNTTNNWQSVIYGNGLFVAVATSGTGNRVMTSPDGITWTSRTSAANNTWNSVTYGNGLFVAVSVSSSDNRVMTSRNETDRMSSVDNKSISPKADVWTSRTSAADNTWESVTYGNGLFVAVSSSGTGNRVMTSPDGITWTARTSAADNSWQEVTYGNGLFVAVAFTGTGNRVMTSPDGITWTARTSAADNAWTSITYGNGLFVAVACGVSSTNCNPTSGGNRVMTSPDGINWTVRTATADLIWNSVTYSNGLFVAVSQTGTGNRVMTSPDGITWTTRTSAADNNWNFVTYGNGLFVAVAESGTGNRVMTSPDGITWTARTSAADNLWESVAYGNGLFVAVSRTGTGNRVMSGPAFNAAVGDPLAAQNTVLTNTTSDSLRLRINVGVSARTWEAGDTYQKPLSLQYAERSGSVCSTTESWYDVGVAPWTSRTSATDNNWNSVTYGNGLFVAVSSSGTGNRVMTSPDGTTWTSRTSAADESWQAVTYGNGLFVAVGNGSIMTSPNGITWTSRTVPSAKGWHSVTYGNGKFVAVASAGDASLDVMTSTDGINWTAGNSAGSIGVSYLSVTHGNGLFVAVGVNETQDIFNGVQIIMTSPDGINWTSRSPVSVILTLNSVTYGNGLFVAVGESATSDRQIMTSPDGITWNFQTSAANNSWKSVTYGNGLFVAVSSSGTGNRVMTSPDGITWTARTSAADNWWQSVVYGNGIFAAVAITGTGNRVMTMNQIINLGGNKASPIGYMATSANDPTESGATIRPQVYSAQSKVTNVTNIAVGEYAQFDFDVDISRADYQQSYCFRVVYADGTALASYGTIPEMTRCTVPPTSLKMRHGAAFCAGSKRFMWNRF